MQPDSEDDIPIYAVFDNELEYAVSDDELEQAATSANFSIGMCTDARVCPVAN